MKKYGKCASANASVLCDGAAAQPSVRGCWLTGECVYLSGEMEDVGVAEHSGTAHGGVCERAQLQSQIFGRHRRMDRLHVDTHASPSASFIHSFIIIIVIIIIIRTIIITDSSRLVRRG